MSAASVKKELPSHLQVPWKPWEALSALILAFVIPLVIYIVLRAVGFAHILPSGASTVLFGSGPVTETVWYFVQVLSEIVFLSLILKKHGQKFSALGLKKFRFWKALVLVIFSYIGFLIVLAGLFAAISILFPHANLNQAQVTGFEGVSSRAGIIMGFLVLVVLAPIVEEMFFRGLLFPSLLRRHSVVFAALSSSLIFGLFHAQLNIGLYTGLLGLFLCFLYYRLGSIIPGMSLHMINNLLAFLVLFKFIS